MRITETGISMNYLANINQSREKIVDLQSDLASGKRVQKPSDDPIATDTIMRLQASLDRNAQYSKNISDGKGMLDSTVSALDSLSTIFQNIKNIVVHTENGTATDALPVSADSIDQLVSEVIDVANTKFNGKFVFGGTQTLQAPYALSADRSTVESNPAGISGTITYPVGDAVSQQVNLSGDEVFQGTGIIETLMQIRDTMRSGSPPTAEQAAALDDAYNHILDCSGKAGYFSQGLDLLNSNLDEQKTQLSQFLSNAQDTDVAEAVLQLQNSELMLNASVSTAAKVLPSTLLDFLK